MCTTRTTPAAANNGHIGLWDRYICLVSNYWVRSHFYTATDDTSTTTASIEATTTDSNITGLGQSPILQTL